MERIENIDYCIRYLMAQEGVETAIPDTLPEKQLLLRALMLEFGIGYNTPGIIRFPFEQMAQKFPHTTLVRFNRDHPDPYLQDLPRFIAFTEINECLNVL